MFPVLPNLIVLILNNNLMNEQWFINSIISLVQPPFPVFYISNPPTFHSTNLINLAKRMWLSLGTQSLQCLCRAINPEPFITYTFLIPLSWPIRWQTNPRKISPTRSFLARNTGLLNYYLGTGAGRERKGLQRTRRKIKMRMPKGWLPRTVLCSSK